MLTFPSSISDNVVTRTSTDTLTNKTLTTPIIASLYTSGTNLLTFPASISDNVVTRTSPDTLTNKTLTSPTLTTPVLGVATVTSINKVLFTAPATVATLTLAEGSTLTTAANVTHAGAFAQTFTATAATNVTLPTTGTLATLAGTETLTGKTLTSPTLTTPSLGAATATSINKVLFTAPATVATLTLAEGSTLTTAANVTHAGAFAQTFTATAATNVTLPTTGTLATLAGTETLTGKTLTTPTITSPAISGTATVTGSATVTTSVSTPGVNATYLELGAYATSADPYIDFKNNTVYDYNARIQLTGGSSNAVSGTLNYIAGVHSFTNGNVTIGVNNASTNTTTGSLQVTGGVGITGNVYVGGNVVANNLPKFWNSSRVNGTGGVATTGPYYYLIGTLGDFNTGSNAGSIYIKGTLGQWVLPNRATVDIAITSRGGSATSVNVLGTINSVTTLANILTYVDFAIYYQGGAGNAAGPQYYVYMVTQATNFVWFDLTVTGNSLANTSDVTLYDPAVGTLTTPAGTKLTTPSSVLSALQTYVISNVLEVRGDGSTVTGKLQLNCPLNSHGQKIAPQPHAQSATNTLLLPGGTTIGNSDAVLVSDTGTQTLTNKTITAPTLSGISYVDRIAELIANPSAGTTSFDYSTGSVFNYSLTSSANITASFLRVNPSAVTNRTFVASLIISSGTYKGYVSAITVSSTGTTGSANTLYFNGGAAAISISSASVIVQTFAFVYTSSGSAPAFTLSNVASYQI